MVYLEMMNALSVVRGNDCAATDVKLKQEDDPTLISASL